MSQQTNLQAELVAELDLMRDSEGTPTPWWLLWALAGTGTILGVTLVGRPRAT